MTLKSGSTRYRLVVDVGRSPEGERLQHTATFDHLKEARAELSRIRHELGAGTYVPPLDLTVNAYLDEYLKGATRERRTSTRTCYEDAMRCPRLRFGHRPLQSITKNDVEELIEYMLTEGRIRGGKVGTGLAPRTVRLALGRLRAAFAMAVKEGKLVRNVVELAEWPSQVRFRPSTWTQDQVNEFLARLGEDRLFPAWRLTLYGLRRGEVLGLRWSDLDLSAKEVTIRQARIPVDYRVVVNAPKSENGIRTLPLDDELIAAFKALRRRQAEENENAGRDYGIGLKDLERYGRANFYVVVDAEWYSDEFHRQRKATGLPRIRLHDSRYATFSLIHGEGRRTDLDPHRV